jgi:sporulation protein YlmC with PRC-barrel domain
MLKYPSFISLVAALSALALVGPAQAQQAQLSEPNLSGTYRCQPQPSPCTWQGQTLTISQSGPTIKLNINKGEFAEAKLTSNISVSAGPPYNANGLIMPDQSIQWSNGTEWLKQSSTALAETPPPNAGSAATTVTATVAPVSTTSWITKEAADQRRISKLIGVNVYNNASEKIGDVAEIIMDRGGKLAAVVVGVGGFLGLGEHDVAIPYGQISWVDRPDPTTTGGGSRSLGNPEGPRSYPDHAFLNMTKDQLKAAPAFKFSH